MGVLGNIENTRFIVVKKTKNTNSFKNSVARNISGQAIILAGKP